MNRSAPKIYLVGTGGQGTLTATRLLAQAALCAGVEVVAGEVHGMAQRGGVVESAILLGGWRSPRLDHGEADIMVAFEALEALRGLPYLKKGGVIFASSDELPPLDVCLGNAIYPAQTTIREQCSALASQCHFMPCAETGAKAGSKRAGNLALLGALCASGLLPFGTEALACAIDKHLPEKLRASNLAALHLGAEIYANMRHEGKDD